MVNLPPLGTTSSQPAKKPKNGIIPLAEMFQMANGMPMGGVPDPLDFQGIPGGRVNAPVTTPYEPRLVEPPEPKPTYVDNSSTSTQKAEPKTMEEWAAYYGIKMPQRWQTSSLPAPLPGLTLPGNPQRDVRGEGQDQFEQASLSTWLPLLSLLTTGGTGTGVDLLPNAFTSIAQGTERFQDKSWQAEDENYKDTIQRMLQQRSLDESTRSQQVSNVLQERAEEGRVFDDQLASAKELLRYRIAEERMEQDRKKQFGTERNQFMRVLQRTPEHQQLALWNSVKDRWEDWGISPVIDETGKYHPLTHSTDIIGYANAKTAKDRLDFMDKAFNGKSRQWEKQHELNVQKAKDAVTMKKLDVSARVEIAKLARESAWDRANLRESGMNARFDDNIELKRAVFFQNWKMKMDSKGGVKINQLFDRAEGLRLHRRALNAQIQAVMKEKTSGKFSKSEREGLIKKYEDELAVITPLIEDAENRISVLIDERDSGYITEGFVDRMIPDSISQSYYDIIDPKGKTAGDAGSKARAKSGYGNRPNYAPGFSKPLPPKGPSVPPKAAMAPKTYAPRPAQPAKSGGAWKTVKDPETGQTFRIRAKN
jgi:hypothetical protein